MAQVKDQSSATQQPANDSGQQSQQRGLSRRREDFLPSLWAESPFALMRRFSEEMDRFFGGTFPDFGWDRRWSAPRLARGLGLSQIQWSPSMEILERDNELVIRADLPGLSKDDINVEVTDDMLTIAGERREERDETREGYRHSERRYGRFSRSFPLPEGINAEDVKAAFQNGVLEVTMPAPKREQRGRRIEIQEGAGESARPSSEQPKTTQ